MSKVNLSKGNTINTDNIKPGDLIQIDFCFLDETSIHKVTCILVMVDLNTRKMWTFCTPGKRIPLGTFIFILE